MKVRAAAMIEALENKEIEVQRIPGKYQLADIGTKTLPKTVLYSLMYQLNMIDGKEAEEFVRRLEEVPQVRSIRIKEIDIEIGPISLFFITIALILACIRESIQVICRKIKEAIIAKVKKLFGPPQWEEDVIEMINARTEVIEEFIERKARQQREQEEANEREWDIVTEGRTVGTAGSSNDHEIRAEGSREYEREISGRLRKVQLRTLKVQSQTNGLKGKFVVLTQREQGVHEEQTEERQFENTKTTKKTVSIQTEVTYTFQKTKPRFEEKKTA